MIDDKCSRKMRASKKAWECHVRMGVCGIAGLNGISRKGLTEKVSLEQ